MRLIIIIVGSCSYKQISSLSCGRLRLTPMDSLFLRELPAVSLADGKPKTFIVDFPESRPSIEHVKLMVDKWRAQIVKKHN